jgi:hypothetical protein
MSSRRQVITAVASLILAVPFRTATADVEHSSRSRRLSISSDQIIATEIQTAHAAGDLMPHLTLHAESVGSLAVNSTNDDFEVHVREAVPAVSSETTLSVEGGRSQYVNLENVATMLVSDELGVLALISVDELGGTTNGIVKKDNQKSVKFKQNGLRGKVRRGCSLFEHTSFLLNFVFIHQYSNHCVII